ncbi:MAG: RT0821/Lpp0805 family surface protein [Bdellovibrionales bacterium]
MIRKSVVAALAASILLTACQAQNWGGGETVGTLGGAAAGGLIGSQIGHGSGNAAATLAGVLIGGFAGNQLGGMVDDNDRRRAAAAEQRAYSAPIGQQITWNNPNNGNSGVVVPVRDGYAQNGAYCREFQETIVVGGQKKQGYGTACQQPDGSWKIISQ